jgi:adenylate cyclase
MGQPELLLVGGALLAGAGVAVARGLRAERRRLRERLEAAAGELQRLQTSFARFAPSAVVEGIVARGRPTDAERKDVTVLFADLVGFTPLSEDLSPEVLVAVLNEYFGRMSRAIGEHRGHVSKFIGDGLMALFGALEPNPWQANDAVHAALAMQRALAAYNGELAGRGLPALRLGVGIHRGPAIAGVIGSHELMEFTVIGQTVNLASRIERLTRIHRADILVSAAVRPALDPHFVLEEFPPLDVRGVSEPVVTYAVRGFREEGESTEACIRAPRVR